MAKRHNLFLIVLTIITMCTSGCLQPCAKEGESIEDMENPLKCCSGLEMIDPKELSEIGSILGVCTAKCGNGVCDSVESYYNCEKDCPKKIPTCAEAGGECGEGECIGIHFDIGEEVSDCLGQCCGCCKEIIPECVPAECCHPTSCVLKQWAPDCSNTVCTEECREGTMDCGCGACEFTYDKADNCHVIWADNVECSPPPHDDF